MRDRSYQRREGEAMEELIRTVCIAGPHQAAGACARKRWNAIAKPIGSLGLLEDQVVQVAELTGCEHVDISRRCVAVLCADNGVVAEGVTQTGQDVTAIVARNVARGVSSLCRMCAPARVDCLAVDMGMAKRVDEVDIVDLRIADGTQDIAVGPAMTREQAVEAIVRGMELVADLKRRGYTLVAAGEMGIGNTTTATAMACAFTDMAPEELVGRGAGLSNEGLIRKTRVVAQALRVNQPQADDPLDVLCKLGGFDIAGMVGMFLGGAVHRVPVVMDGAISVVAAYCAVCLRPECRLAILPSHLSSEPAARVLMERMGMRAPIAADMHLGEGTGAACLIPLLDMAVSLYTDGVSFDACGIAPYEVRP